MASSIGPRGGRAEAIDKIHSAIFLVLPKYVEKSFGGRKSARLRGEKGVRREWHEDFPYAIPSRALRA